MLAGAMLANPQIEGWLSVTPKLVQGQDLKLTSAKWNGKLSLLIDLVTGRFDVSLSGAMQRYLIPGLGIVDVITDLKVVPGPNGHGSHVVGTAKAWVRRFDNSFFREPHRRAAVADHQPRARERRDRPLHQPAALFAQAAAVGRGRSGSRTAPSTSPPPGGRRNTVRSSWCSTATSNGPGSTSSSIARTTRSGSPPCTSRSIRLLRATITGRAAARGSGRSPATGRSCCRTMRRR